MMNYRADKHTFELSEAEWNDSREAIAERDALLEDNERLRIELERIDKIAVDQTQEIARLKIREVSTGKTLGLRAKLATVKDELIDALNELVNVKAELATIKPSWKDAPKWAEWHIIEACYYGKYMKSADTVRIKEYRPEDS